MNSKKLINNLVSIITPSYNSEKFISKTIDSVISQTYENWEMIIVDDVSPDNVNEIIEEYIKKDSRIKLIKLEKNSGAAFARNRAIEEAKGRFIAFLDADDCWKKDKLEIQINFMIKNDYAFTYTAYEKIDENGNFLGNMGVPQKVSYSNLLKTCVIGCLTSVYDVQKLGKVYMPTNTKREDFATWLSILKKIDFAYGIKENLSQYRVYENQSSGKKAKMAKENWKLYREIEKLNLLKACYYFSHYAVRGVLRTKFPKIARFIGFLD
ncbi:putative teichuronic acid biosynthesis glycosyltransferase TuaG [Aliarcobacter thereius]|uniref:Putative teichuronic acid biosynthesis glycosyltransferase TuaG n=1 Tax=Aliarcobacter thereius TaxID=544718 RepID=A0A1C0B6N8_9BACT|nr:glycosyltransferase family 2 protein [Aliarcobacter thereius]OCL99253.1 putative teichuronic acid biosynthesis glycosyltransferase TuaG [Aliarcobacter thereius]